LIQLDLGTVQGTVEVQLNDLSGAAISMSSFARVEGVLTLDYQHLPAGSYLLEITNNGTKRTERIAILH
jgi:hypothetical protein